MITLALAAGRPESCCAGRCNAPAVTAVRTHEVLPVPMCAEHAYREEEAARATAADLAAWSSLDA